MIFIIIASINLISNEKIAIKAGQNDPPILPFGKLTKTFIHPDIFVPEFPGMNAKCRTANNSAKIENL